MKPDEMESTRVTRASLLRVGGAAALAAGLGPWGRLIDSAHAADPGANAWMLQLDGLIAGRLQTFVGGVANPQGATPPSPISMTAGFGLDPGFYRWLESLPSNRPLRPNVTVDHTDSTGTAKRELRFFGALLTGLTIPGCDVSSTAPGFLGAAAQTESVKRSKPTAAIQGLPAGTNWRQRDFKLAIQGIDHPGATRIAPFTVKMEASIVQKGVGQFVVVPGGPAVFPQLSVVVNARARPQWMSWRKAVAAGRTDARNGTLTLLMPDRVASLATIDFVGLLPIKATLDPVTKLTMMQLVVDSMSVRFGS